MIFNKVHVFNLKFHNLNKLYFYLSANEVLLKLFFSIKSTNITQSFSGLAYYLKSLNGLDLIQFVYS